MALKFNPTRTDTESDREFIKIQQTLENLEAPVITYSDTKVAPNNPGDGEVRFSSQAGILGVAAGLYVFHTGAWNFIA